VPAGPSRKAAAWPFILRLRDGNCWRTQAMSSGLALAAGSEVAAELIFGWVTLREIGNHSA
jgi:hypothetical protein